MNTANAQDTSTPAGRRVAVLGGGPAGLTVAHELAERGFTVDVYDRNDTLGGKSRSFSWAGTGTSGRADLPYNSGGHFFFGFYPNIGETLQRIPLGDGRTALDNLTVGDGGRMVIPIFWGGAGVTIAMGARAGLRGALDPRTLLMNLRGALTVAGQIGPRDCAILASKVAVACTSGDKRRWEQFEHLTSGELFRSDALSSHGARRLAEELSSNVTVANAEDDNARVVARVIEGLVSSMLGHHGHGLKSPATVLNDPENDAWLDPWARHLARLGVRFHLQHTVTELSHDDGRIVGATVCDAAGEEVPIDADWFVLAVPADKAASLMSEELVAADPALRRIARLRPLKGVSISIFLKHKLPDLGAVFVIGDAPWQNGSEVLTSIWQKDMTSYGDGTVAELISAQITDPAFEHQPGPLYGKPAKECTPAEVVDEVLTMFRRHVPDGERLFAEDAIHSWVIAGAEDNDPDAPIALDEQLFAPTRSCWQDQPEQQTRIQNLFLAGTHTRTIMGCDSMDGANESGKRAANALLRAAGDASAPAKVPTWSAHPLLRPLQRWDDRRYAADKRNLFDFIAPAPTEPDRVHAADPAARWEAAIR